MNAKCVALGMILVGVGMTSSSVSLAAETATSRTATKTTTTKTTTTNRDDGDRAGGTTTVVSGIPNLEVMDWDINSSGTVDVSFLAQFPLGHDYILCWKETGAWNFTCWSNEVEVASGGGAGCFTTSLGVSDGYESPLNIWDWQVDLESDSWAFSGYGGELDPIECGVEYKFKLAHDTLFNDFFDTEIVTFSCDGPEEEEEECTSCPYGGWYDGAHCTLGTAPAGTTASIQNGWFAYASNTASTTKCLPGDVQLRSGACAMSQIPSDTNSFIYQNGWYYGAVCE